MGYYADTTSKLLDQIGNPYISTSQVTNPAFDLSSLIMAMMFMPQTSKVLGETPLPPAKTLPKGILESAPGLDPEIFPQAASLKGDSIFPQLFGGAQATGAGPQINPMFANLLKPNFSLGMGGRGNVPSILGNPEQVQAFLKLLGII